MVSQIEDAKKFIQHQVIKDRNTNLLQAINTAFNSVVQNLSKKHLNLENKSSEEIAKEFFDAIRIDSEIRQYLKIKKPKELTVEFLSVVGGLAGLNRILNRVKIFLYAGVNPNMHYDPALTERARGPTTALIFAIRLNNSEIAEILLNAGANP